MTKDDNILADQIKLLAGEDVEPTPELIEAEYRSLAMPMANAAYSCLTSSLDTMVTSERLYKKVQVIRQLSGEESHDEVEDAIKLIAAFREMVREYLDKLQKGVDQLH